MSKPPKKFVYSHERPSIAADIVAMGVRRLPAVLAQRDGEMQMMLLLVHRSDTSKAFPGFWALPGGFFKPTDASIEYCARRELKEETNLDAKALIPFGNFSAPQRDPRGWYTSVPYLAIVSAITEFVEQNVDTIICVGRREFKVGKLHEYQRYFGRTF